MTVALPRRLSDERLDLHHDTGSLAEDWDALADRAAASPFMRPGWIDEWWRAFGSGRLEILALRRDGELAGVLPMCRSRGSLRSLTNWHSPEYEVVAKDAAAREAILEALLSSTRRPVTLAFLTDGKPESRTLLDMARGKGCRVHARRLERSPWVPIDGDWERYESALATRTRSEIRRRRRRLEEQGELRLTVEDGSERLPELLEEGFRLEASGWKAEQGTAIVSRPETRRFYTAVARWAARRGWLRLAFLELDGRPFAFQYLIQADGSIFQLKGGFDVQFRKYAPGMLLNHAILARCFEEGLASYEFLGDEDEFKREWTSDVRERMLVQVFPRSPAGIAGWAAYTHGRPLAKRIRDLARR